MNDNERKLKESPQERGRKRTAPICGRGTVLKLKESPQERGRKKAEETGNPFSEQLKESPQERGRKLSRITRHASAEKNWKKVPKKGDENSGYSGRSPAPSGWIERKSPRKGTKISCIRRTDSCDQLKESPQERGRKFPMVHEPKAMENIIERKSPRKGTKMRDYPWWNVSCHYWKKVPKKGDENCPWFRDSRYSRC